MSEYQELLPQVIDIARRAGDAIMKIYATDFEVNDKHDGSPLTIADHAANDIIEQSLAKLPLKLPLVSEESPRPDYEEHRHWQRYWLIDPLDGTKEFVNRRDEFTVNIALIDSGRPVLGVVCAPVLDLTYYAAEGVGAFKQQDDNEPVPITTRPWQGGKATIVASRSHANTGALVQFFNQLEDYETRSMGSSLKLCLVAEGVADVYPRLGPTSEWDTAAAHCVVNVAGGQVTTLGGEPLQYNKPDILNPMFVVSDRQDPPWLGLLSHVDANAAS